MPNSMKIVLSLLELSRRKVYIKTAVSTAALYIKSLLSNLCFYVASQRNLNTFTPAEVGHIHSCGSRCHTMGLRSKSAVLLRPLIPLTKVPRRLYPAICFVLGCFKNVNRPRYYIQLSILMWIVGYAFFNLTSAPKAGQPNNAEVWLKVRRGPE